MTADGYVIRNLTRAEFDTVVEWAVAEAWNPGRHDADAFYAADPTGFYAGVLDGDLIGSISAVKYGPGYVFWGFYIVKPEHRGKRYGLRLWRHAESQLGGALAGLDGVMAQTHNYARSGFVDAYHNQRYQGVPNVSGGTDPHVTPYTPADLEAVERYDRDCFPAPRHEFLSRWLQQPGAHALLYRDGDSLRGYGMLRPAHDGYRYGPLFADDEEVADALFDALASRVPAGTTTYIDVPQANADALEVVIKRGMTPMFETARMYRGPAPGIDIEKVFGVTTLELG
jgi:predicted N-acetyltransferase YhbS